MDKYEHLCMGCMKDIGTSVQCPFCGYQKGILQEAPYLQPGTVIDGRYLLGRKLDSNGDGATYIAWHIDRGVPVTVREYLPDAIAFRNFGETWLNVMNGCEMVYYDCMQNFFDLWRKLARMRGLSALIPVFDIVEANGTAYAISEHIEGVSLRDYLLRSGTGSLSWEQARVLFMPVLSTIGALHNAGVIHRGISPDTLLVSRDGKVRLTGFCIRQARCAVGELNAELAEGFAAVEQYGVDLRQGPWTDVYSFAAVLYRALIGAVPLDATKRAVNDTLMIPARFAELLPPHVIEALINALQVLPEDRTKTIDQLRTELSSPAPVRTVRQIYNPSAQPAHTPPQEVNRAVVERKTEDSGARGKNAASSKKKSSGNGFKVAFIALLLLVIASVAGLGIYYGMSSGYFSSSLSADDTTEYTTPPATVPNFVGRTKETVMAEPRYQEYFELVFENQYSMDVEKGYIIDQSQNADTQVAKGTEIILYVSLGPPSVIIPDVSSLQYEDAEDILTELQLVCEIRYKYNDGTHQAGTVDDTLPAQGNSVLAGTKIFINVWMEIETEPESTTARTWPWDWLF